MTSFSQHLLGQPRLEAHGDALLVVGEHAAVRGCTSIMFGRLTPSSRTRNGNATLPMLTIANSLSSRFV